MATGEIRSLTGLRGVAAFYIAFYHWVLIDPVFDNAKDSWPVAFTFINHGYLAVDVFFVLSGFVIALSYKNHFQPHFKKKVYIHFLIRRLIRIYPVYVVALLTAFFLLPNQHDTNWKVLVESLFFLQIIDKSLYILGPTWSLCTEWIAYLLFPFLLRFVYNRNEKWWSWAIIGSCLATILLVGFTHQPLAPEGTFVPLPNTTFNYNIINGPVAIIRCLSEFTMGIFILRIYSTGTNISRLSVPILITCCIMLCLPHADILFIGLLPLLILSISRDKGIIASFLTSKPFYYFGQISYSVYLFHIILVFYRYDLGVVLNKWGVPHYTIASIAIMIALLFIISTLSFTLVETRLARALRNLLLP